MLFNSIQFAVFFTVTVAMYFWLPHRFRWAMLLIASCYFYMAFIPVYILILFFTIGIDYVSGLLIEGAAGNRRRFFLTLSILGNVSVLAVFKYWNFLNGNVTWLAHEIGTPYSIRNLSLVLPIGLSFHTFQSLSYTIEVYRGRQAAERHLGIFALYVMFFPQLVAGPIERPQNLLPQFRAFHVFDYDRAVEGLKLMAWGLFMKAVVADNFAPAVNAVYNAPASHTGLALAAATVFFSFQIYCDFAGYSYMAIGAARVIGFDLMENFRQPYFSTSIAEFWRRWHISLSTWFRDYLYLPLGGNRVARPHWALNILIVFAVSGLWHGANWTFVVWGLLHGMYLIVSASFQSTFPEAEGALTARWPAAWRLAKMAATFVAVSFAWIFFRAPHLSDALYIASHLSGGLNTLRTIEIPRTALLGMTVVGAVEIIQQQEPMLQALARQPVAWRWAIYYGLTVLILAAGRFVQPEFIYFQF